MKIKVFLIAFIILGLSYSSILIFTKDNSPTISQKEVEEIVSNLYGGKVVKAELAQESGDYQLMFENEKGVYNVSVDSETKEISNLRLVEKKEALVTLDEARENIEKQLGTQVNQIKEIKKEGQPFVEATVEKGNKHYRIEYDLKEKMIVSNTEIMSSESQPLNISEQEAKDIALQQTHGKITDLSIVNIQNGKHYKVTVDDHSEGAHVYVQADTGKVSSISRYSEQPDSQTQQQSKSQQQPKSEQQSKSQQQSKSEQQPKPQQQPTSQQQPSKIKTGETDDDDDDDDDDDQDDDQDDDDDDDDESDD